MADGATYLQFSTDITGTDLETAISLIESGDAPETLVVDLGDGCFARADGRLGLQGLLQRLRGHRLLMTVAQAGQDETVLPLRDGEPEIEPQVAAILDALKN